MSDQPQHPNIAILNRYLAAAASGDFSTARSLLAEDIILHIPGNNVLSGDHSGPDAVMGTFGVMMTLTDGTYGIREVVDMLSSDTRCVLLAKQSATRHGQLFEFVRTIVFEMEAGQMKRATILEENQAASDAFWGPA